MKYTLSSLQTTIVTFTSPCESSIKFSNNEPLKTTIMSLLQVVVATEKTALQFLWEYLGQHINWNWLWTVVFIPAWRYGKKIYQWVKDMESIRKQMPAINDKLDRIVSFVLPNGGSSMSDTLTRIERRSVITQQLAWSQKEHSDDGFFLANEKGEWTRVNKTFLKLISADAEDVLTDGWGWVGYLSNSCREATMKEYNLAVEKRRGTEIECIFKRDYAAVWHVSLSLQPMRNDGKIVGYTGTIKLKP